MKKLLNDLPNKQKKLIYSLTLIILIAFISLAVWQYNKNKNAEEMLQASTEYQKAILTYENSSISSSTKTNGFTKVIQEYPHTAFAIFSSWYLASDAINNTSFNNFDIKNLQASANNGKANYNKAISILENSAKENPNNNLTNITKTRLARLYIATNQIDKAISTINSIATSQQTSYTLLILGDAYHANGNNEKATEIWKKAKNLNTNPDIDNLLNKKINSII
ncbi:YfgM family protein [Pseudofrancisella aestuarii]|uniref:Ancillary SecYEG translocon subunit n=1 Tax=Pseudofrancisella aestuarii TaxID=2670347 RepID=A0ABV9TBV9_9GAMM|nr:tetratricopeptide repeat protein [Pseudofrancisella aestuarii]